MIRTHLRRYRFPWQLFPFTHFYVLYWAYEWNWKPNNRRVFVEFHYHKDQNQRVNIFAQGEWVTSGSGRSCSGLSGLRCDHHSWFNCIGFDRCIGSQFPGSFIDCCHFYSLSGCENPTYAATNFQYLLVCAAIKFSIGSNWAWETSKAPFA